MLEKERQHKSMKKLADKREQKFSEQTKEREHRQ